MRGTIVMHCDALWCRMIFSDAVWCRHPEKCPIFRRCDTQWYAVIRSDTVWYKITKNQLSDSKWCRVMQSDSWVMHMYDIWLWYRVMQGDAQWCTVTMLCYRSDAQWCRVIYEWYMVHDAIVMQSDNSVLHVSCVMQSAMGRNIDARMSFDNFLVFCITVASLCITLVSEWCKSDAEWCKKT